MARLGLFAIVIGGVLGFAGYAEWRVSKGASVEPEEVSLEQLIRRGPEGNAHVRVRDFNVGDNIVYEEQSGSWTKVYVPAFPLEPGEVIPEAPPTGPVSALFKSTKAKNEDELLREFAAIPVQGLVTNRIESLGSEETKLLTESYPGTDFDKCLIVQIGRKPASQAKVAGFLGGGTALIVVGILLMVAAYKKSGSIF